VAVLIGANAPLVIDPAWRATYADATTDFCKPSSSECRVRCCSKRAGGSHSPVFLVFVKGQLACSRAQHEAVLQRCIILLMALGVKG
jgi:hypothetical protein